MNGINLAKRIKPPSPSEIKKRCESYVNVAEAIEAGLNGDPFHWGLGEARAYCAKAEDMGITLVTKNQAARLGYRLRRGVQPVGRRYFGAPISNVGSLYVLECQCQRDKGADPANGVASAQAGKG